MKSSEEPKHIFVSGHRNPDIDSIAGACALAELRRRQNRIPVTALCPGPVKTGFWARAGVTEMESFNFTVMDSRKVAEYGLKALFAKRAVATCGFTNKMLTVAAQIAPRFLTRMVSRAMLDQLNRPPKKEDKKP